MLNKGWARLQCQIFTDSGWFKQFQNHFSVHNVKLSDESASTDVKAAKEFLKTLD